MGPREQQQQKRQSGFLNLIPENINHHFTIQWKVSDEIAMLFSSAVMLGFFYVHRKFPRTPRNGISWKTLASGAFGGSVATFLVLGFDRLEHRERTDVENQAPGEGSGVGIASAAGGELGVAAHDAHPPKRSSSKSRSKQRDVSTTELDWKQIRKWKPLDQEWPWPGQCKPVRLRTYDWKVCARAREFGIVGFYLHRKGHHGAMPFEIHVRADKGPSIAQNEVQREEWLTVTGTRGGCGTVVSARELLHADKVYIDIIPRGAVDEQMRDDLEDETALSSLMGRVKRAKRKVQSRLRKKDMDDE